MAGYQDILSPLGARSPSASEYATKAKRTTNKPVIGLLDNSKPNVAEFLNAVEAELRARNDSYEFARLKKPRSAMACPELDAFAARCDYVINAVAD